MKQKVILYSISVILIIFVQIGCTNGIINEESELAASTSLSNQNIDLPPDASLTPTSTKVLPTTTPSLTQTLEPTITPTPTETPTPTRVALQGIIAYVSESSDDKGRESLWLTNPDGSEKREAIPGRTDIRSLAWSPDGQMIAFFDEDITITNFGGSGLGLEIYFINDGTITQFESVEILPFWQKILWSPDSKLLLLSMSTGAGSVYQILDITTDTILSSFDDDSYQGIAFSPDSTLLAFGTGQEMFWLNENPVNDLKLIDWKNGSKEVIQKTDELMDQFTIHKWFSDGRILYSFEDYNATGSPSFWEISMWTIIPGEEPQPAPDEFQVYNQNLVDERMPEDRRAWNYSISPDQNWITFSSKDKIYLFHWETGEVIGPIADGTNPIWQPTP